MMKPPATKDRRSGISSFQVDDDIPIPTADQIAAAAEKGKGLGFHSEKPEPATPAADKPRVGGNGRVAVFTMNFHIRTRPEDRERFEDFAYRHRISKGEAMKRLLDLAERAEGQNSEEGRG